MALVRSVVARRNRRRYQQGREAADTSRVCNAPSTNMYFSVNGTVSPCWLHFPMRPPKWSPSRSLLDIWNGPEFTRARTALAAGRFPRPCKPCQVDIEAGRHPLAAAYDNGHPIGEWPTMLELELSNLCNLECIMCSGQLSSRIRKYREHKPPIVSPYDETFVEQVVEVLPHLHEIRFNGGEPLLQPIVRQITEHIADLRPDLKVTIATNGTVLNHHVRDLLSRCNVHVNVSIDSLVPDRYARIRINADLDEVLGNFEVYREYCQDGDRNLCVMVNPMRVNWDEMANYVRWCNERDVHLWFNTIRYPEHLALHNLPASELEHIHATLAAEALPDPGDGPHRGIREHNIRVFRRFVDGQLTSWLEEARAEPGRGAGVPVAIGARPEAS
jgi:molybdenum cofactor biosynthesis enzyme MoaA